MRPSPPRAGAAAPANAPPSPGPAAGVGDPNALESIRRLKALKERVAKELEHETRLRREERARDPIVPLSLAGEFGQGDGASRSKLMQTPAGARIPPKAHDRISALARDQKWLQRELELELEKKAQETASLTAHNARLRDMVSLRQEANKRREHAVQEEVDRLRRVADDVCVYAGDMDATMEHLRSMNHRIQEGADRLQAGIEETAENERLGLVRAFRVKMREIKAQVAGQQGLNMEGARVLVDRHDRIKARVHAAQDELERLERKSARLTVQLEEATAMLRHQREQRRAMTTRVAVVKRENRRLDEHVARLEGELAAAGGPDAAAALCSGPGSAPGSAVPTRPHSQAAADGAGDGRAGALRQVRGAMEQIRRRLKQVRGAHIELLQERTELEMFVRQCIEDARRDLYRCTVVANLGRTMQDAPTPMVRNYTAADRRTLAQVLHCRLRVLAALHAAAFPHAVADSWGDADAAALGEPGGGDETAAMAGGRLPATDVVALRDAAAEAEVDRLWDTWKAWSARRVA